jgi:hypothetical protein
MVKVTRKKQGQYALLIINYLCINSLLHIRMCKSPRKSISSSLSSLLSFKIIILKDNNYKPKEENH